jgi:hypothetical protein
MMFGIIRTPVSRCILATLAAVAVPLAAQAATMNIHTTDMDVTYMAATSGGSVFDAMGGFSGGNFAEGTADDITSADFEVDSNIVASLSNTAANGDDIHVDFRVTNIGPLSKSNSVVTVGNNGFNFGLDFFTDAGHQLSFDTDEVSILINNNIFLVTGELELDLDDPQVLPLGLSFDPTQPIQFSFVANFPSLPVGGIGTPINVAVASGVLTISGTVVPEPAAQLLILGSMAMVGMFVVRRRPQVAYAHASGQHKT